MTRARRAAPPLVPRVLAAALVLAALFGPPPAGAQGGAGEARELEPRESVLYEVVEWRFPVGEAVDDPFDVVAEAVFRHEDGARRRAELFWDGGDAWGLRFNGDLPGRWRVAVTSEIAALDGLAGEVVVADDPDARGFLRPLPAAEGTLWARQRGGGLEPLVPALAMAAPLTDYAADPALLDAHLDLFLGDHGFTGLHLSTIGGGWFDLDGDREVTAAMRDPDPRTFRALEDVIARTHAAGGTVHLWLWGDHRRRQTPRSLAGGLGGAEERRLMRYFAARLGALPGWSVGYGFDLDEWIDAAQLAAWERHLAGHLGWPHLAGGRPAGPNRGTDHAVDAAWNEGLPYASYEHHEPGWAELRAAVRASPGQPVMSEDRFRIRGADGPGKDVTEVQTRRLLWHSALAGGVAGIYGNLTEPDGSVRSSGASAAYPHPEWSRTWRRFLLEEGRFGPGLAPARRGATLLLQDADHAIVYAEDSARIRLQPAAHARRVVAVDAAAPYRELELGVVGPEGGTLLLPRRSDWALWLTREGPDAP